MVERAETITEAATSKGTLVTEAALISTLVQTQIQASQDIPTTLITANALLLLTIDPRLIEQHLKLFLNQLSLQLLILRKYHLKNLH